MLNSIDLRPAQLELLQTVAFDLSCLKSPG